MIRAAFIGVGSISPVHLNFARARRDVRIAAVCDIRPEQAAKHQGEYGGEAFTDYAAMLDRIKPDAVWICTPSGVRRGPLLACAERGIPAFCEKPTERSEAGAAAIARDLARRKARVQIGYVFRSIPAVRRLREVWQDDAIHLVQSFYACGVSLNMALPAWFYDQAKSGGALVDQATHNLDLLRSLFGEVRTVLGCARNPVRNKKGAYTIDETLSLSLAFANGLVGSHSHTWVGDAWRNELVFSGEKRLYRLFPALGRLVVEQPGVKSGNPFGRALARTAAPGVFQFEPKPGSMYDYEDAIFLEMVKTGNWRGNPCSYADGVKTLRLTLGCVRALAEGCAEL